MAKRHVFTKDELSLYFDRICMPTSRRIYDVRALDGNGRFDFLSLLQKHHLVKCPWENLTQHYSWHRTVTIRPSLLFDKIVRHPGRGGYCMEVNYFYHLMLFNLGFDVYMAGSRIYRGDHYGGWTHVINVVTIGGQRYLLDGGFGGQGPPRPVKLVHGEVSPQIVPAQLRLLHENIPQNLNPDQKVWIYQYRYNENSEWSPMYCFTDLEFTPEDIESMNFAPSTSRYTFFTHKVVASRFSTDKEIDSDDLPASPGELELEGEIDGSMTINHDNLKWRRRGEKVVHFSFKTDDDRVRSLKKYFGITLADEDREAIINTMAMIGVKAMGVDD